MCNIKKNILRGKYMRDYECYHVICQYSSDKCSGCKHEMDCYNHFLNYMLRGKEYE